MVCDEIRLCLLSLEVPIGLGTAEFDHVVVSGFIKGFLVLAGHIHATPVGTGYAAIENSKGNILFPTGGRICIINCKVDSVCKGTTSDRTGTERFRGKVEKRTYMHGNTGDIVGMPFAVLVGNLRRILGGNQIGFGFGSLDRPVRLRIAKLDHIIFSGFVKSLFIGSAVDVDTIPICRDNFSALYGNGSGFLPPRRGKSIIHCEIYAIGIFGSFCLFGRGRNCLLNNRFRGYSL